MKDYAKEIEAIMPNNCSTTDFSYMLANLVSYAMYKGYIVEVLEGVTDEGENLWGEFTDPKEILQYIRFCKT